jgi:hypothetical protein
LSLRDDNYSPGAEQAAGAVESADSRTEYDPKNTPQRQERLHVVDFRDVGNCRKTGPLSSMKITKIETINTGN